MADKPKREDHKTMLSDEVVERMRAQIIHGTGYGQPPKDNQFRKGQSGNPKGRPRKAALDLTLSQQLLLSAVHAVLKRTIKARDGDKIVEMSAHEALAQAALNFALKGNARYAGMLIDAGRQADEATARETEKSNAFWENYQTATRSVMDDAKQKGEPTPEFLPHPDDVVIDSETGPRFMGPTDDDGLKRMQETQRMVDVLLMQDLLDQRSTVRLDGQPLREPGGALLFAMVLNDTLPPRVRLSSTDILMKQMKFGRLTKRELLKSLYNSWRKLGRQVPRGAVFCDMSAAKEHLTLAADFMRGARTGVLDVEAIANGEFNEAAPDFLEQHGHNSE